MSGFAGILTPLPLQFIRQTGQAPFVDMVFETTADRMSYLTSVRKYAGMIVSDKEANGGQGGTFSLNTAEDTWMPMSSSSSGPEIAATFATISVSTNIRFVFVIADETNYGDSSLYIYTGTNLKFLLIVPAT